MSASASTPVAFRSESSLSAYGTARSTIEGKPLNPDELRKIDAYWRASLYLCLGMLYLKANPLLREPLKIGAHEAAAPGPLGLRPRPVLHLHSLQSADQEVRPERDLYPRPRARGAGGPVPGLSRGHLFRDLPGQERRPGGDAALLQAVLVSRAASAATPRRKRQAASTRAASWATAFHTPMGRSSTTQT